MEPRNPKKQRLIKFIQKNEPFYEFADMSGHSIEQLQVIKKRFLKEGKRVVRLAALFLVLLISSCQDQDAAKIEAIKTNGEDQAREEQSMLVDKAAYNLTDQQSHYLYSFKYDTAGAYDRKLDSVKKVNKKAGIKENHH